MMYRTLLLVGFGGFLGSVSRYLIALFFVKSITSSFPYGTFLVNIIGCFLIGLFYGLSKQYEWFNPALTLLLVTGFCGGFTTFSAFAFENLSLLQTGNYLLFAIYSTASFVFGLFAAYGGMMLIKATMK